MTAKVMVFSLTGNSTNFPYLSIVNHDTMEQPTPEKNTPGPELGFEEVRVHVVLSLFRPSAGTRNLFPARDHEESCNMTTKSVPVKPNIPSFCIGPARLHHLVDIGAPYLPQALSSSQFNTLFNLLQLMMPEANPVDLAAQLDSALVSANDVRLTPRPLAFDYTFALDELNALARLRTGYAFFDLTPEIQHAMLNLIATGDITTRRLDLSLWLNDLHRNASACLSPPR
jgi:hypothetical protein